MEKNPKFLKVSTPHYKYELTIYETLHPLRKFTFFVGEKEHPCLEGILILENNTKNSRFNSMINTAKLIKIEALQECSLDDITDEYMAKYSFGTELLESILFFINSQFPMIETISLNDASYIPCIRDSKDTLDLLLYSIALYGKTWYEAKINAYIQPKEKYEEYRKKVERYSSKERKSELEFIDMYKLVLQASDFTKETFDKNYEEFETLFETSETLPEFFRAISKKINRNEKCRFFKDWLETFISSQIPIERTWYIDLFPKFERIHSKSKRITRKKNRP